MTAHGHALELPAENRSLGDLAPRLIVPAAAAGILGLAIAFAVGVFAPDLRPRFYQAYLVNFLFFLAIGLGALFFTMIHHLTKAGWSVTVRRLAEAIALNLPWMALLFVPLVFGLFDHQLFKWANPVLIDPASPEFDPLVYAKKDYLNPTFFLVRAAIYFGVWAFLAWYMWSRSVRQDATGDPELSKRMQVVSAPGMLLFGLTLTFAAIDWAKATDPHFFSTIWGVYFFAGCATAFFSTIIIAIVGLQSSGRIGASVTTEHLHDLGKLLFAFGMVFWAYIAFSQYMLIWYANIPEETLWFQPRASGLPVEEAAAEGLDYVPGIWNAWSWFLIVGHFMVPFVLLISRVPKRRKPMLLVGAIWMLFMAWYDIFWLVMPVFHPEDPGFHWLDFVPLVGLGGVLLALTAMRLRGRSLIPEQDPRLEESLSFENV